MKQFDIPSFYRSPVISQLKRLRRDSDPRKKDYSPTLLDFGPVRFLIARHFGFCYGVENAIEKSYRAVEENPGKRIFLLSEMIHNPEVNKDLNSRGVQFIMETDGTQIIPWESLRPEDVVIIPAFGTTIEIKDRLTAMGIETRTYDTTCPFVEKVWKRAEELGGKVFTVVVHGRPNHEETRATFSHAQQNAPTVIVRDMADAVLLGEIILGSRPVTEFASLFEGRYSAGFDPQRDLGRIGVVNQTTMLASETQAIADHLRQCMVQKHGEEWKQHFADTRDTLCYATYDNQRATFGLLEQAADLAIIVGGYNSSNTSHLVELCQEKYPSYFVTGAAQFLSEERVRHFDLEEKHEVETQGWLPAQRPVTIILTSGASCPDSIVDEVMQKVLSFFPGAAVPEQVLEALMKS